MSSLNTLLGQPSADTITKRMMHDIILQNNKLAACENEDEVKAWFKGMNDMLCFCRGTEDGSVKSQALLLYEIMQAWPDLPSDICDQYANNFWFYAEAKTGRDRATLENHFRAVQAFLVESTGPATTVRLPQRDAFGLLVKDKEGKQLYRHVEWNPISVPISKLVAITARAKSGGMTDELWSMAADPGCTWEQLQIGLSSKKGDDSGIVSHQMEFFLAGPYLFVREGNQEAYVADTSIQHDIEPGTITFALRDRALRRMMLLLGVKEVDDATEALKRSGLELYKGE